MIRSFFFVLRLAIAWMLDNMVFIVTNSLILVTAVVGQLVFLRAQRKSKRAGR